jgi:hypothetical protein
MNPVKNLSGKSGITNRYGVLESLGNSGLCCIITILLHHNDNLVVYSLHSWF